MRVRRAILVVLIGACMALAVPAVAQDIHDLSAASPAVASIDRSTLNAEVVARWRDEAVAQGADVRAWETDMARALRSQSDGQLVAIRSAASWKDAARLLGARTVPLPTVLGDDATDLVYFPLPPCRILDTRLGTGLWAGPLASGSDTYVAHNQNLVAQGGTAAGCGVPTDPAAILATVTVVPTSGPGDLRVYAYGTTLPNASVINYALYAGLNLANSTIIPTGQITGYDFRIKVDGAATHVVVDVAGYFWKPSAFPTAGQAFAHLSTTGFVGTRHKGFASVTYPAAGVWCLVASAGVDLAVSTPVVSVDYSYTGPSTAVAHWRSSGLGCNAGELAVYLWNSSTGAALAGGVTVFVP